MSLSILLLLVLVLYAPLGMAFYVLYDKNKKVAKRFLVVAILLVVVIIFLAVFLMFTCNPLYFAIVLLQSFTLLLNIRTFRKNF